MTLHLKQLFFSVALGMWSVKRLFLVFSLRSSVRLTIRKIQFSPDVSKVVPVAETTFEFLMSEKPLHIKMSLPKEVRQHLTTQPPAHWTCTSDPSVWSDPPQTFYHGESVPVNVEITNSSSRNIKDINVSGEQNNLDVCHHAPVLSRPVKNVCLCSVEQVTNVVLYSNDKYVKSVAKEETEWAKLSWWLFLRSWIFSTVMAFLFRFG